MLHECLGFINFNSLGFVASKPKKSAMVLGGIEPTQESPGSLKQQLPPFEVIAIMKEAR
jgi:hypothetical protein